MFLTNQADVINDHRNNISVNIDGGAADIGIPSAESPSVQKAELFNAIQIALGGGKVQINKKSNVNVNPNIVSYKPAPTASQQVSIANDDNKELSLELKRCHDNIIFQHTRITYFENRDRSVWAYIDEMQVT